MKAFVLKLRGRRGGANLASVIGTAVAIGAFIFYPQVFYGFAGYVWRTTLSQMATIGHHSPSQIVHMRRAPVAKHVRVKRAGR